MNWPYRHIVIVAAADRAAANLVAASIDPDDGSGTFGVPLSADGSGPATHFGCSGLSDDVIAGAMYDADVADPPVLPSVQWWRLDAVGLLIDSNTLFGTPGEAWTWLDALDALGLQRVETEVI